MSRRNREITKRRWKKIIRESMLRESHGGLPCPIETAEQLKAAGAQPDEVMAWVGELMEVYRGAAPGGEEVALTAAPTPDPLAVVAMERYRRTGTAVGGIRNDMVQARNHGGHFFGVGFKKY